MEGYTKGVAYLRQKIPGVKIYVATLTSALQSTPTHGRPEVDAKRKALNQMFKSGKVFDGVIDFDAATFDTATGQVEGGVPAQLLDRRPRRQSSTPTAPATPAMANAIDLAVVTGSPVPR